MSAGSLLRLPGSGRALRRLAVRRRRCCVLKGFSGEALLLVSPVLSRAIESARECTQVRMSLHKIQKYRSARNAALTRAVLFGVLRRRRERWVALTSQCYAQGQMTAAASDAARPVACGVQVALVRCVVDWKRREPTTSQDRGGGVRRCPDERGLEAAIRGSHDGLSIPGPASSNEISLHSL